MTEFFEMRQSDNWSYKYYRYDERGRVKTMWLILDGLDLKTVSYEYNSQGMVKSLNYNIGADFKRYRYRYDIAGRLQTVDTYEGPETTDDPTYYQSFTDYEYNPNSFIITQNFLGGFTGTSLGYDNRGRISSYYSHNSEFIYNLTYLRNSNILQQELYGSYRDYFANTEDLVYKFTYDKSNRLLSATNFAGSSNEYKVENSYDMDGNILTMKRYVDAGNMQDNFTYQYYSGTNKLSRVTGNVDQFRYDLNGNVTTDSVYNNFSISYDHRNLITELYHIDTLTSTRQYSYATRYWYDETGNRVRKLTYRNAQIPPPQINDWGNPGNGWTLLNNEHYVRGVDGKELATYFGNTLTEWYVWASDMVGKIKGSAKYYFFKDHLGSVRAVVDNNFNLVSAVDYDMWGDKVQGRIYNGDSTKFGFTGKEEDDENLYDYFGARYYDSRIGRWGQVEPLMEKYYSFTPYSYAVLNPLVFKDINGKDAIAEVEGNRISVRIYLNYSRYSKQNKDGLSNKQISFLNDLEKEVEDLWSGYVELDGAQYEISVDVILGEFDTHIDALLQTERNDGQNFVENASTDDFIEGNIGLGSVRSGMFIRSDFAPRKYSASHEVGHLLGLPDLGQNDRSVMGYHKDRVGPKASTRQDVLKSANLDYSITGKQIIRGFER